MIDAYVNLCDPVGEWIGGLCGDGTIRPVHVHRDRDGVLRMYYGYECKSGERVKKMVVTLEGLT